MRLLLILAITTVCFFPVVQGTYTHVDDDAYVYRNDHVREGLSLENVGWAFRSIEVSNWHPLTWLSYMLDVELFGMSAAPMHAVNLLLHLANSVMIFLLIHRFMSLDAALLASLIFAIHPLHVEPVAWISQRKELLSFLFLLLSAHAYLGYKVEGRLSGYWWSLAAYAGALMSKPMAVSFPFLLMLLDYWPLQQWPGLSDFPRLKRYALEKLPYFLMAAFACLMALIAHANAITTVSHYTPGDRVILVILAYVEYLRQFLAPAGLTFYYPMPPLEMSLYFWACLALLIGLAGASVALAGRYPFLFVGWWWYVIALLPVIGLVKVGGQFVADRYTYLPFTGAILALALLFQWLAQHPGRKRYLIAGAAVVFLSYGVITQDYARSWRNDVALARRAILRTPDNPIAYYVLVKGVEVQLTQKLLDALSAESGCVEGRIDVFAGIPDDGLSCLRGKASPGSADRLLLAAQHIREYELDEAAALLNSTLATASREGIYLTAIQRVLSDDRDNLPASIEAIMALPEDGMRASALFLGYYQLGEMESANAYLNDALRTMAT